MLKASEARQNSKDNISSETEVELLAAEVSIKKSVDEGKFSCWCYTYLHEQTITYLRTLGYQVNNCSDQREGTMFEIKW